MFSPTTCSPEKAGGMTIASFVIAIVGVCLGLAALIMAIINTVRIGRLKKRFDTRDAATVDTNKNEVTTRLGGNNTLFHPTLTTPYYACIFTSQKNHLESNAIDGYGKLADEMAKLAKNQEGYLGIDSSSYGANGLGITVSYWATDNATKEWKKQVDHSAAQMILGKGRFYSDYHVHIAKVEREYMLNK